MSRTRRAVVERRDVVKVVRPKVREVRCHGCGSYFAEEELSPLWASDGRVIGMYCVGCL